ncbi:MAG TPA: hypothetical protein VGE09_13775 [Pseudoxanthomonas sp.]
MTTTSAQMLSLRVDKPREAAEQVGKAIGQMVGGYLDMADKRDDDKAAGVFIACLMGNVAGQLACWIGADEASKLLAFVSTQVSQLATEMDGAEPRTH